MLEWMYSLRVELPPDLSTESLRVVRDDYYHRTLWDHAAEDGRIDVCEFLKSRGLLDMIEEPSGLELGWTPLHRALAEKNENTARWLIDHTANVNAIDPLGCTVFYYACEGMNATFMEELAAKVAPEHLARPDDIDRSPMRAAFICNQHHYLAIVRMLILRGVPVRPHNFPASRPDNFPVSFVDENLLPRRRTVLDSIQADLHLNDTIFLGHVLAAGVHAPDATPAYTKTSTTATTKRVRTQRPDGSFSAPVVVPCEPRQVITATPTTTISSTQQPANQLPKLRGFGNSEVRMAVASYLGVRPAAELGRLRAAHEVLAEMPEEEY